LTCAACRKTKTHITQQVVVSAYESNAMRLVRKTKYGASRSAADEMARCISLALPALPPSNVLVVPLCTTQDRKRWRGFDQAERMARTIARTNSYTYAPMLRRVATGHQVGATRAQRITHMRSGFEVVSGPLGRDTTVILVDDVVTTGATMDAAARAVRAAGAETIIAAYFARAE
jgi:ComF family protein